VWTSIKHHVREELGLVNLTSVGTGNSDSDGDFILDQIRQIIIGTITCHGLYVKIPGPVRPGYPAVDKEYIDIVPFCMGDFSKLETPGSRLIFILAQNKKKIRHSHPHFFELNSPMSKKISLNS
jgi:hypothetical protein